MVAAEREMLTAAGHEVDTYELNNPDQATKAAAALVRAPWNSGAAAGVVERAVSFGADVAHVHNTWFALSPAVFRALSSAGFPTVATMHNYRSVCANALLYRDNRICQDCVGRGPWPGVLHRCYHGSVIQSGVVAVTIATQRSRRVWERDVDVVVALTDFSAAVLASSGIPSDRIVVKPNTIADPGERSKPPSKGDVVCFVGRLVEEKGVFDLTDAWERIPDIDARLVIAGDGPAAEDLRALELPRLSVPGPLTTAAVRQLMSEARCLVLPTRLFEGFPMVMLEAMASGLGVVIPNHGALPGIAGEGGLVFEPGDASDLARVIARVAEDSVADRLGAAGRQRFLANYTDDQGLSVLEAVYQRAIETRRGRSA